jgi:hypothetical protein
LVVALSALAPLWTGAPGAVALEGRAGAEPPLDAAVQRTAAEPATALPLERYHEVLARPLFSPSRRAAAAEAEPMQATELPVLQGVVLARDKRIALLAVGNPSSVRRVKEGQDIGQWHIEKILADHVALRSPEGKTTIVRLKFAGADKARQAVNSETNEPQAARSGPKR